MDKTQKRQLESNDLGESVLNAFEKIQPYLAHILIAVLVLAVAYIGFKVYSASVRSKEALISEKIFSSVNRPAELEEIAQKASAPLNAWAWNLAGNARLAEAVGKVPANRASAIDDLTQAESDFKAALNSSNDEAKQMAYFGLGRVFEQKVATTTEKSSENVKTAIDYYNKLTTRWPDGIYARQAKSRLADLNSEGFVKMLSDYASYEYQEPKEGERNDIPLDITAPNPADVEPAEEPAKEEAAPAEEPAKEEAAPAEEPAKEEAAPAEEPAKEEAAPAEEPAKEEAAPAEEPAKEEAAPAEEPAKEEAAPAEEPAKEEAAPAEEPAKEEAAPAEEPAKDEAAPAEEPAKEEAAPAEEPAKEEAAPAEEPAKEEAAPAEEPAKEEAAPAEEPAKEEAAPAEEPAKEEAAPAEEPAKEEAAPAEEPAKEEAAPAEEPAKEEAAPAEEPAKEEAAPAEEKPAEEAK